MCNYYEVPDPEAFEKGFRPLRRQLQLFPKGVGPFDFGLFLRPAPEGGLEPVLGQWGMIRPGAPNRWEYKTRNGVKTKQQMLTNNCRLDSILPLPGTRPKPTFAAAWAKGQRCLVPMASYQEPNWETKKNIWWRLRRADGDPWAIAGLWSEWTDGKTGEVVPNFTCITVNCDHHPLLNRLHKPDPKLGPDEQDKRSLVHIDQADWDTWLHGTANEAAALLVPAHAQLFDRSDAERTDQILQGIIAATQVPVRTAVQVGLFSEETSRPSGE